MKLDGAKWRFEGVHRTKSSCKESHLTQSNLEQAHNPPALCVKQNSVTSSTNTSASPLPIDQLPSQAGLPPLPPAPHQHKQHPSVTSLNQSLANQPTELQSASECVQLQENWVLGGNVGLGNRYVILYTVINLLTHSLTVFSVLYIVNDNMGKEWKKISEWILMLF